MACDAVVPAPLEVVDINVGGKVFSATKETLLRSGFFTTLFESGVGVTRDAQRRVFVDRDGRLFEYILNFMRHDTFGLPKGFDDYDRLVDEVDFYQVDCQLPGYKIRKMQRKALERELESSGLLKEFQEAILPKCFDVARYGVSEACVNVDGDPSAENAYRKMMGQPELMRVLADMCGFGSQIDCYLNGPKDYGVRITWK
eukprot:TRINITY_DN68982_c0_g1_i1.p1 TRINITY_DN68982_c0_g1~~TRINITY_DN68982_c0_g1_i1.p1  ORF type:complete len:200 (+),score=39.46 TRINITY_DN68982_c0_g1_i1:47-646(+)